MSEDEIKAWFFKYGQYANGRDMALIKAIEAAIKPQRTWVGLMRGVRVEGDKVIISVHYGNDAARQVCGALIKEMNNG